MKAQQLQGERQVAEAHAAQLDRERQERRRANEEWQQAQVEVSPQAMIATHA